MNVLQQGELFDTTVGGEYSMLPKPAMNKASGRSRKSCCSRHQ